jgi:hypothetical protein
MSNFEEKRTVEEVRKSQIFNSSKKLGREVQGCFLAAEANI